MPIMREGPQSEAPPFFSSPSKPIRDSAKIEAIIGPAEFDKWFWEAAAAIYGPLLPDTDVTLYAVLTFNTNERAILVFYDRIDAPPAEEDPDWAPQQWRKKLPDDGGAMYQKA